MTERRDEGDDNPDTADALLLRLDMRTAQGDDMDAGFMQPDLKITWAAFAPPAKSEKQASARERLRQLWCKQRENGEVNPELGAYLDAVSRDILKSTDPGKAMTEYFSCCPARGVKPKTLENLEIAAAVQERMDAGASRDEACEEAGKGRNISPETARNIHHQARKSEVRAEIALRQLNRLRLQKSK